MALKNSHRRNGMAPGGAILSAVPASRRWLFALLVAGVSACGYEPFRVAPRVTLPPEAYSALAERDAIRVRASAFRDEDKILATFDGNLLLAGVMPVRVMLENTGGTSVALSGDGFKLRDGQGKEWKRLSIDRARKRLVAYYEVKAYSESGGKLFAEKFAAHGLPEKIALDPGGGVQGLLFFEISSETRDFAQPLTLEIDRLSPRGRAIVPPLRLPL